MESLIDKLIFVNSNTGENHKEKSHQINNKRQNNKSRSCGNSDETVK